MSDVGLPAAVDMWAAPPGTPIPFTADEPLDERFLDAGAVDGAELLDDRHGLRIAGGPAWVTWRRLVRERRIEVGGRYVLVLEHQLGPLRVRGVLPDVEVTAAHGRTADLLILTPGRWHYAPATSTPNGAPCP